MSGFLEDAITYTFHSALCVRSSSAYRRVLVAILVSYMYRGDGRRNFDAVGEGRREKILFIYFSRFLPNCPPPPKLIWNSSKMAARKIIRNSGPGLWTVYLLPWLHFAGNAPGKGISRENDTDRKFLFSEEFMRSEKHVKHHSYLICNEANFLLGEDKLK